MPRSLRILLPVLGAIAILAGQIQCSSQKNAQPAVAAAITTPPQNETVLAPAAATFTVTASGNPAPTYQWNLNGTAIPGAFSASYSTGATTASMDGASYTVTVGNGTGSPVTSAPAILTVNAAPLFTTPPAAVSVTSGSTATFTTTATGNPAPGYQWNLNGTAIAGATSASYTTPATTLADNGDSYTVTLTNTFGNLTSPPAVLTVDQTQVLATQPASATVIAPAAATFTVSATGNPLSYQWYANGTAITGATSVSYTTGATSLAMNGVVYTVVVGGFGAPVTSSPATLTVDAAPVITLQPASVAVTDPATATFTVSATGNPAPAYQWNLGGTPISGATGASYSTGPTSLAMNGGSYTVTVSNGIGAGLTSSAAVLTVDQVPAITTQPVAQTVTAPAPATFSAAATGFPAPSYQWNLNGVAISGATGASYTTPATSAGMNGQSYTVTVGNGIGTPVTSSAALLTVNAAPIITVQPASLTVTDPATATFTVTATGSPTPTYQWNLGGTPIAGATLASYTTGPTSLAMSGGSYTVTVANGIGAGLTSAAAILTVDQVPAITTAPVPETVTSPAPASFSVVATGYPLTYQWNLNGAPITGATGTTYAIAATSPAMNGNSYTVTVTGVGAPATSAPAVLTVDFAPFITAQPASTTAGVGGTATFTVAASANPAPSYQWYLGANAISGATGSSYTTPAATLAMNGNSYSVTVGNGIGPVLTSSAAILTVTNGAAITTQPSGQTVTAPAPATFTVAASGSPAPTYQWNLNGVAIPGATGASYTTPATSFAMNGGSYTVTVGNGIGSPVTSVPALLTVDVPPAITLQPVGLVVIAPATATFTAAATGNPAPGFQWNLNGNPIPGATSASYTTPATTLAMDQSSYTVTVANGIGSPVTSAAAILSVHTGPVITVQPQPATVTAPATATFSVTATGSPAPAYQWSANGTPITGATGSSYTTPATTLAMNGTSYTVSVSNGIGTAITSNPAQLTVDAAPAFTTQPVSVAVNLPATATFTAAASGNPPPAYQWNLIGTAIPGATSASYTTPATTLAMDQSSYTVTASNGIGTPATSNPAILSVHTGPAITSQPQPVTVTAPATATFSVTATGNPAPTYQWSVNGTAIPGATGASYTTPATSLAMEFNTYAVTLSNGVGPSVTSSGAELFVDVAPAISVQPQPQSIGIGSPLNLSVTASGYPTNFTYQWYLSNSPIPGATSASYSVLSASLGDAGNYYVTVANGIGTPAQSATVGVTVSQNHAVSGRVHYVPTSVNAPGITVTINTTPAQTAVTDVSGDYSFSSVPAGSYTVTPSIIGPSSVFFPTSSDITVSNSDVTVNFGVKLGYVVSGNVSYSGASSGPIYIVLAPTSGGSLQGTTIAAPGGWTIEGVPVGTYKLSAFMAAVDLGALTQNEPQGAWPSNIIVSSADVTGITMTIADSNVSLAGLAGPGLRIFPTDSAVAVTYGSVVNSFGQELATAYHLEWSDTADFATVRGTRTFPLNVPQVAFVGSDPTFVNGNAFYFRIRGEAGGTASNWTTRGPVTIGAASGGNTVSGTVTFAQTPTGPLYVGFYDPNTNTAALSVIQNPVSPQPYTVTGVPSDDNQIWFAVLDQNQDGIVDPGDVNFGLAQSNFFINIQGNLIGQDVTLPSAGGQAKVSSIHMLYTDASDHYAINLRLSDVNKHIIAATLVSGPKAVVPMDLGYSASNQNFSYWIPLGSHVPLVGDVYSVQLTYSDFSTDTLNATVNTVLDSSSFIQTPSPSGNGNGSGIGTDVQPVFSWTAPAAPPAGYQYQFSLTSDNTGQSIWQIPGPNANLNSIPSTITSIVWGVDPTDNTNLPVFSSLSLFTTYTWTVTVIDGGGNQAQLMTSYTP